MTNYEHIMSLSIDDLAECLWYFTSCECCFIYDYCRNNANDRCCVDVLNDWLKTEHKEKN